MRRVRAFVSVITSGLLLYLIGCDRGELPKARPANDGAQTSAPQPVPISEIKLHIDGGSRSQAIIAGKEFKVSGTFRVAHENRPPNIVVKVKDQRGTFADSAVAKIEKTGERQYEFKGTLLAEQPGTYTVVVSNEGQSVAEDTVQVRAR